MAITVGILIPVIGLVLAIFLWIDPELQRVRRALREHYEPDLNFAVRSAGPPVHLLVTVSNHGTGTAHDLVVRATGTDGVWQRPSLDVGEARIGQIELGDDAPLRRVQLDNPKAELEFTNQFEHRTIATVVLTKAARDDGRFNIGSENLQVTKPRLSRRALWKLRTQA